MKPKALNTITTGMSVRMYGRVDRSWWPSIDRKIINERLNQREIYTIFMNEHQINYTNNLNLVVSPGNIDRITVCEAYT